MPSKYVVQGYWGPCRVQKFTIGSDPSRDYAECSDFTSAFDNTLIPENWTTVIVEFHNDTGTDEAVFETPFSVTVPSNCYQLLVTVADDSWHKGDPAKGCVLKCVSGSTSRRMYIGGTMPKKIERLRFDTDGLYTSQGLGIIDQPSAVSTGNPMFQWFDQCIVTGGSTPNPARFMRGIDASGRPMTVTNCLVHDMVCNGSGSASNSYGIGGDDKMNIIGCTVDNVDFTNHTGTGNVGIGSAAAGYFVQNNIVTNVDICYGITGTSTNNVDDDGTGTNTSSSAAEFVDSANNDYTLNSGAVAAGLVSADSTRFGPDLTGQLRDWTNAVDAGCYNNIGGYEQGPSVAGGGLLRVNMNGNVFG